MLELRECLIDRARGAGSAGLGEDSGAHFVRAAEKNLNGKKKLHQEHHNLQIESMSQLPPS